MSEPDIFIENYTEKSFVVYGDTKRYKEQLKQNGGKWNSCLTNKETGEKFGAWIFPNMKRTVIEKWFKTRDSEVVENNNSDSDEILTSTVNNTKRLLNNIGLPSLEQKTNTASIEVMFKQILTRLDSIEEKLGVRTNIKPQTKVESKPEFKSETKSKLVETDDIIIESDDEEVKAPPKRLLGKK